MVDEIEILKNYTGDPQCRTCHGRLRLGINRIPRKDGSSFYQLQLCHCAKPNESEYARLEKVILHQSGLVELQSGVIIKFNQAMMSIQSEQNKLIDRYLYTIHRHTVGYWLTKIFSLPAQLIARVKQWQKHKGDEQGAREQVKDEAKEGMTNEA